MSFDLAKYLKSKKVGENVAVELAPKVLIFRGISGVKDTSQNSKTILFTSNNYIEAIAKTIANKENKFINFTMLINVNHTSDTETITDTSPEKFKEYSGDLCENGFGQVEVRLESLVDLNNKMIQLEKDIRQISKDKKLPLTISYTLVGLDTLSPIIVSNANEYLSALDD